MKIKLSKSQWEQMGKKAGWMKESQLTPPKTPSAEDLLNEINNIVTNLETFRVDKIKDKNNKTGKLMEAIQSLRDFSNSLDRDEYMENMIGQSEGLCPICGVKVNIINLTEDGRLMGSCKDAFTLEQWEAE